MIRLYKEHIISRSRMYASDLLCLVAWNDSMGLSLTMYKHVEHHVPGTCFTPSQYDKFLFATIGAEKNETPLSVLSALVRLDKDPWQEAARLTELPKHQAAQGISTLLAALPGARWTASECNSVAARLVDSCPSATMDLCLQARGSAPSSPSPWR